MTLEDWASKQLGAASAAPGVHRRAVLIGATVGAAAIAVSAIMPSAVMAAAGADVAAQGVRKGLRSVHAPDGSAALMPVVLGDRLTVRRGLPAGTALTLVYDSRLYRSGSRVRLLQGTRAVALPAVRRGGDAAASTATLTLLGRAVLESVAVESALGSGGSPFPGADKTAEVAGFVTATWTLGAALPGGSRLTLAVKAAARPLSGDPCPAAPCRRLRGCRDRLPTAAHQLRVLDPPRQHSFSRDLARLVSVTGGRGDGPGWRGAGPSPASSGSRSDNEEGGLAASRERRLGWPCAPVAAALPAPRRGTNQYGPAGRPSASARPEHRFVIGSVSASAPGGPWSTGARHATPLKTGRSMRDAVVLARSRRR